MHEKINWRPASEKPETLGIEVLMNIFGKRWHCSAKLCVIYRNRESGTCLIGGAVYYKAIDSDKSMWRVLHYSDNTLNDFETDDDKSEFQVIEWAYTNVG